MSVRAPEHVPRGGRAYRLLLRLARRLVEHLANRHTQTVCELEQNVKPGGHGGVLGPYDRQAVHAGRFGQVVDAPAADPA